MRCPSCFKPVADNDVNCPHCGISLSMWKPPASNPVAGGMTGDMAYAGFWARVGASLIDGLIIFVVCWGAMFAAVLGIDSSGVTADGQPDVSFSFWVIYVLLVVVAPWLYFAIMESSSWQGTLGKRAIGLRVTDIDGNRISFGRATGRHFARMLSNLTLGVGYLMAAFTSRKQALHDMVAGTVVTYQDGQSNKTGCLIVGIVAAFFFIVVVGILAAVAIPAYQEYVKKAEAAKAEMDAGAQGMDEMTGEGSQQLLDVVDTANLLATGVEDLYAHDGALPMSIDELEVELADNEEMPMATLGANGVVTVFARDGSLSLSMKPEMLEDGGLGWTCEADGFADEMSLPERCRP